MCPRTPRRLSPATCHCGLHGPARVGCFQDERRVYLVLDYLPGGELFRKIRTAPQGRLQDDEAKFYASEITLALEYLHGHDIVYRDLLPEVLRLFLPNKPKLDGV